MSDQHDWPLGPYLRRAREDAGLSKREAARRAREIHGGRISEARWRQLEDGYQMHKGQQLAIGTTPETVVAAARAVGKPPREALRLARFKRADLPASVLAILDEAPPPDLSAIPTRDLLIELGQRAGVDLAALPDAPPATPLAAKRATRSGRADSPDEGPNNRMVADTTTDLRAADNPDEPLMRDVMESEWGDA